jgi:hypothetical protein
MGAGNAARLAQRHAVHGVWMIDGVKDPTIDATGARVPATWTADPAATDGCRFYTAHHALGSDVPMLTGQFDALGVPDSLVDLDSGADPMGAHRLSTAQAAVPGGSHHSSMARDQELPTDATSGAPAASPSDAHVFDGYAWTLCAIAAVDPACDAG